MSGSAVVGALHVVFDADNQDFDDALDQSQAKVGAFEKALETLVEKVRDAGDKVRTLGVGMAAAFTASLTAVSSVSLHAAADFETAMRRVDQSLGGLAPDQLKALSDQAKALGESTGRGAAAASEAMLDLANAGTRTSEIMGGAFAASLKLAAIAQSDLAPATALTSQLLRTFSLDAANLNPVIDQITGALLAGHGGLEAYKQAVADAGDQAVAVGISFADFNTTVASLGAVLGKGADAGSSFKEFLAKLQDPSDTAKQEMKDLGASFFDAAGKLKPMADIAQVLKDKFAGLTDQTRGKVFEEMFGSSGMETAISLMREGKQGFLDLQSTIDKASGDTQAARAQEGYAAAVERLGAAFQNVKVAIGQAGLVDLMTGIANAFTKFLNSLAEIAPAFYKVGAAIAGFSDILGPLSVLVGGALYLAFGIWLRSLGPLGWAVSALVEPVGTLVAGLRVLVTTLLATDAAASFAGALAMIAAPLAIIAVGIGAVVYAWHAHNVAVAESAAAQERLRGTMDGAKPALDKAAQAVADLTGKTGEAARAARDHANAMLAEANAAVIAAEATARKRMETANAAAAEANSYDKAAKGTQFGASGSAAAFAVDQGSGALHERAQMAQAEAKAAKDGYDQAVAYRDRINTALNAPPPKPIKYTPPDGKTKSDDDGKSERHGPTPADLQIEKEIEAARLSGNVAEEQRLQDQLSLNKQIEAYQRAGLTLDDARGRAQRDMAAVTAARAVSEQKAINDQERSVSIEVATLDQNYQLEDSLERQANLEKLIDFYKQQGLTQAAAEARAAADQAKIDDAKAKQRQRWADDDADAEKLRMAQLRGDSDEEIRLLQRVIDVKKRARDLEQNEHLSPDDAMAQANKEADQQHQAELQGQFRDIFKGGFKAALDGNIGDWFQNWWKDRVQKGMEQALNNLADLIAKLFSHSADGATGSNGGFLGALGSLLGLGKSSSTIPGVTGGVTDPGDLISNVPIDLSGIATDLPPFATGGSFTIGGKSGIDQNVVAFRGSLGETVDIRRPGADAGGGGRTVHQTVNVQGGVDLATRSESLRLAAATKAATMAAFDDMQSRRG